MRLALLVFLGLPAALAAQESRPASRPVNVHDLQVTRIDGTRQKLSDYAGKALLIVNVASECGYTPQYEGLQKLQERYGPMGFAVLGFPSNDFGKQEPGSDAEILEFCTSQYRVTFPMFSKLAVKGPEAAPLYRRLQEAGAQDGAVKWNFHKFLIGKDGAVIRGFGTKVTPENPELMGAIEKAIGTGNAETRPEDRGVRFAVVAFEGLQLPDGTTFSRSRENLLRRKVITMDPDTPYVPPPGVRWAPSIGMPDEGEYVWFDPEFWGDGRPGFTEADFEDVEPGLGFNKQRTVVLTVTPNRRNDFERYTTKWSRHQIAIVVDGRFVASRGLLLRPRDQFMFELPRSYSDKDHQALLERFRRR